jgi:TRAP-type mannitol/chloroaromatic compound transport system permease small subunit
MIHFVYLFAFAIFVAVAFSIFANGTTKERIIYGLKIFAQFVVISLVLAWIFYFIPGK